MDLMLLKGHLTELTLTPYFKKNLTTYTNGLIAVINYLLENYDATPRQISEQVCNHIWTASKYLRGSISKEIPYEVEYALSIALNDWLKSHDFVITTALSNDRDFHFYKLDTWKNINTLLPGFHYPHFNGLLVHIALPRLYKHRPLYNVALYHEIGHFIDSHFGITKYTFLITPPYKQPVPQLQQIQNEHEASIRQEFFADLFAASYVGNANCKLLFEIARDMPLTQTHPATNDRISVTGDYVSGKTNNVIDLFQQALLALHLPVLSKKYSVPDISNCFSNLRPYAIENDEELHGIMEASWELYEKALERKNEPWSFLDEFEISRLINDLTEKSIRNKAISAKWCHGTSD